jgi:hypothetical protein
MVQVMRTQRYSTYAFSAFVAMHLTNTSIIPLITQSVAKSESYLLLTRPYYQNRPFEPLLIGIPLVVHIASGLGLRLIRRRSAGKRFASSADKLSLSERKKLWPPVSVISATGFASIFLVQGHAIINRAVPLWTEGSSANVGLEYVAHGISKHPVLARVGFAALVWTAVFHMTWGWAKWLGWTPQQVTSAVVKEGQSVEAVKNRRWYTINGVMIGTVALWMAGAMGVVGRNGPAVGWVAAVYDGMYENIPIFGRWY